MWFYIDNDTTTVVGYNHIEIKNSFWVLQISKLDHLICIRMRTGMKRSREGANAARLEWKGNRGVGRGRLE